MLLAQTKAEFSKKKFERRRALSSEKLLSVQEADDAEAEYRVALSEIQVAKEINKALLWSLNNKMHCWQQDLYIALSMVSYLISKLFSGEVVEIGGRKANLKNSAD